MLIVIALARGNIKKSCLPEWSYTPGSGYRDREKIFPEVYVYQEFPKIANKVLTSHNYILLYVLCLIFVNDSSLPSHK